MDRSMQLRHLEEAERHVAQGNRHIAEQEERIADFARHGYDVTEARKLLENFYMTQVQHIQHRDRIRNELEQQAEEALSADPALARLPGDEIAQRGQAIQN